VKSAIYCKKQGFRSTLFWSRSGSGCNLKFWCGSKNRLIQIWIRNTSKKFAKSFINFVTKYLLVGMCVSGNIAATILSSLLVCVAPRRAVFDILYSQYKRYSNRISRLLKKRYIYIEREINQDKINISDN